MAKLTDACATGMDEDVDALVLVLADDDALAFVDDDVLAFADVLVLVLVGEDALAPADGEALALADDEALALADDEALALVDDDVIVPAAVAVAAAAACCVTGRVGSSGMENCRADSVVVWVTSMVVPGASAGAASLPQEGSSAASTNAKIQSFFTGKSHPRPSRRTGRR